MMKALEKLRDTLCEELDKVAKKNDMSAGDLEVTHKLTDTIKNIDKIMMLEGDEGYSQDGGYSQNNSYRGSYSDGNSYANRGKHYVRGHYSRADGRGMRTDRYSRDGYSRDDGRDAMMSKLQDMMQNAVSDRERDAIRRCMDEIQNA